MTDVTAGLRGEPPKILTALGALISWNDREEREREGISDRRDMHRRKKLSRNGDLSGEDNDDDDDDDDDDNGRDAGWLSNTTRYRKRQRLHVVAFLSLITAAILCLVLTKRMALLRIMTFLPVALAAYDGLTASSTADRILSFTLVLTVLCGQLPIYGGAAIAVSVITAFSLATKKIPDPQQRVPNNRSFVAVLMATILLACVLLTENFMVWVVSATFPPGYRAITAPPPLQDNGRIALNWLLQDFDHSDVVQLRRVWNVQWSLVACAAASLITTELALHPMRHMYSIGIRAAVTLSAARAIRTGSFVLTVMPSQNRNCYVEHYPMPPPDNWKDWIAVGLLPASHGGCNDLIVSGHATVTSVLACVSTSVGNSRFAVALWSLVILDYCVEIYEGFHYAVDMFLGFVLVCLLWKVMSPVEGVSIATAAAASTTETAHTWFQHVTWKDICLYSIPSLVAYVQVTVLPPKVVNATIVAFVGAATIGYAVVAPRANDAAMQHAYQHFSQHIIINLLFLALAVYL